jgi:hypothetical protein
VVGVHIVLSSGLRKLDESRFAPAAQLRPDHTEAVSRQPLSRRLRKIKAQKPAGIYAKALLVQSRPASAELALCLAEDLVTCKPLRASLWPATETVPADGMTA